MIDLDKLRKSEGYMLAIVDTKTGEYKPVNKDLQVIRHGKWITKEIMMHNYYAITGFKCSVCGEVLLMIDPNKLRESKGHMLAIGNTKTDYCPHCGARMDEE